ncbi:hypothetical protein [Geoglobus acetivorans]|uniref:Uncharacterized protein n=1 Tax=Geoglobus acetivorans TaxID=565033 RepID=A0ABZ3H0N7_GEOAI|nr:hypothetical protein [Geoglobus acetivorans]
MTEEGLKKIYQRVNVTRSLESERKLKKPKLRLRVKEGKNVEKVKEVLKDGLLIPQVLYKSPISETPVELKSSVEVGKDLLKIPQLNCKHHFYERHHDLDTKTFIAPRAGIILVPNMKTGNVTELTCYELNASLERVSYKKSIKIPQIYIKIARTPILYEKFLDKPPIVGNEGHKFIKGQAVTEDGVKKIENRFKQELTEKDEETRLGLCEDILEEILPTRKGDWRIISLQRPFCLIVAGEHADGLEMVEYLVSTKYTYQGQYKFAKGLPWQRDVLVEVAEWMKRKTGVRHIPARKISKKEDPYSSIISEDLIVLVSANENDKVEIVRGLREISKRGSKCIILYVSNIKPFEDLDRRVLDVDIAIVSLPERSEKIRKLVGKLLGVDLLAIGEPEWESIDELWAVAVRLYEEELKRLDKELPEDVEYFPDRESRFHYLMKRITYSYLKKKGYKDIRVEQQIPLIDENGFVGYVIPDIVADEEYWEVETGYPSSDEKELIIEHWSPHARLVWKLSKYKDNPSKIRVVFPAIYAYLFYDEIRKIKAYFEKRGYDIKFYTIYLRGKGELRRFA